MEVVDESYALLSNYEVLDLLRNLKHDQSGAKSFLQSLSDRKRHLTDEKGLQNLNTIVYETMEYLEHAPCSVQTPESLRNFMLAIKDFNLTKGEKLQLLNLRPKTLVEIELVIEEAVERLSEEQMQQILDIVSQTLPPMPVPEEAEMADDEAAVDDEDEESS